MYSSSGNFANSKKKNKKKDLIKFSEKKEMFKKRKINKLTCFVEVQQNHV